MAAENEPLARAKVVPPRAAGADAHTVYVFGLEVTGLPGLPASPDPPLAGSPRATALRTVKAAEMRERWEPRHARRLIDRRAPDGSLVLAVDEDPGIGYRIDAPEVGVHLVSADGTEVFLPERHGPDWFWQRLLFAQTLPVAATLQGLGLFHASAVRIGDHAVGVSAPSGAGKSSTATHLIAQGAEFFTDDVLALDVAQGSVIAFAGPEFSSIEEHEIRAVEPSRRESLGPLLGESSKQHRRPALSATCLPLGALYLLERHAQVGEVQLDPLDRSGTATLLASAFIPHLSTEGRLVRHLELCGQMATAGKILRVRIPLRASATAVARALMADSRRRLSTHGQPLGASN